MNLLNKNLFLSSALSTLDDAWHSSQAHAQQTEARLIFIFSSHQSRTWKMGRKQFH